MYVLLKRKEEFEVSQMQATRLKQNARHHNTNYSSEQPPLLRHLSNGNKKRILYRRVNYFNNRIVDLWNNLPLSTTDFTNLRGFDKSVSNDYLLVYCKLNFTWTLNNVLSTSVAITCVYAYMYIICVMCICKYECMYCIILYFVVTCKRPFGLLLLNKVK